MNSQSKNKFAAFILERKILVEDCVLAIRDIGQTLARGFRDAALTFPPNHCLPHVSAGGGPTE